MQNIRVVFFIVCSVILQAQTTNSEIVIDSVTVTKIHTKKNQTSVETFIDQRKIRQQKSENLAEILKTSSGVGLLQNGANNSKPIIQGLSNQRLVIINNGVKLGSQHWGSDHAPEIDPFFVQDIKIVKGAEAIPYGSGAMGGVVVLNSKNLPKNTGVQGDISIIGQDNSQKWGGGISLEGRPYFLPSFAWRVQGNIKKSGDYSTAEYVVNNTGMQEQNLHFQAEYVLAKHRLEVDYTKLYSKTGIYIGSRTGDIEDFERKIKLGRPYFSDSFSYAIQTPYQQVSHTVWKAVWKQKYDFANIDLSYNLQENHRQEFEARRGDLAKKPSQDWFLTTHHWNLDIDKSYQNFKTQIGVDVVRQKNYNEPGNGVTPIIPNHVSENYAVYAIQTYRKKDWKGELGIRYDYRFLNLAGYNTFDEYYSAKKEFKNFTYSLGLYYEVRKYLQVTSHLGFAWRPPEANELFMDGYNHGIAIYYLGNKNLSEEKGWKWSNKILFSFPKTTIEINAFLQKINGFIYEVPSGQYRTTFSGVYPIFRYRQDNALFQGIDVSIKQNFTQNIHYQVNASLVYARNSDNQLPLPMIPSERIVQNISFKLPDFDMFNENYLQLDHTWVNKQTRFNPTQDLVNFTPEAYHLFGMKLGTAVAYSSTKKINLDLSVSNIFNVLYKEYTDRFRYFAHLPGRQIQFVTTINF